MGTASPLIDCHPEERLTLMSSTTTTSTSTILYEASTTVLMLYSTSDAHEIGQTLGHRPHNHNQYFYNHNYRYDNYHNHTNRHGKELLSLAFPQLVFYGYHRNMT